MTEVQDVEAAVGEDDRAALRAQLGGEPRRAVARRARGPPSGTPGSPSAATISCPVTVAAPNFPTFTAAATFASQAASPGSAPAASASATVAPTTSPAPVSSTSCLRARRERESRCRRRAARAPCRPGRA